MLSTNKENIFKYNKIGYNTILRSLKGSKMNLVWYELNRLDFLNFDSSIKLANWLLRSAIRPQSLSKELKDNSNNSLIYVNYRVYSVAINS